MIPMRCTTRKLLSTSAYTVRTHTCNELNISNKGRRNALYRTGSVSVEQLCIGMMFLFADEKVSVMGWLSHKRMDRFFVLRDAYGSVQAKIPKDSKLRSLLKETPYESVIRVDGVVVDRGDNQNQKMRTGEIEIEVEKFTILNRAVADIPMLPDAHSTEKTRLKYRYIDLRSDKLQRALRLRSEFVHNLRKFLVEKNGFVDVETPTLFRRTPGGATEFVVPAPPPNHGLAYSLPQSPQQFKQLLMVGGIDRYFQVRNFLRSYSFFSFQIARCYRDEGSKGDRQPEFTQVDVEMSFTTQEGVMQLIEDMILAAWPESLNHIKPTSPFPRIPYSEAMRLYGIDKPDMRVSWKIEDVEGKIFESLLKEGDEARVIICRGAAKTSISNGTRTEWKRLIEMNENGRNFAVCQPSAKKNWFKTIENRQIIEKFGLTKEDVLLVCWGESEGVYWTLGSVERISISQFKNSGQLRNYVAEVCGLRSKNEVTAHWVVDFPLFSIEEGKLMSTHHPFTAPVDADKGLLYQKDQLLQITGQHYDLVINGVEMGGGSMRIENSDVQRHVLDILGEPMEEMNHLLNALAHGAPPHGGFALGLDRFVALLTSEGNPMTPVRDVIAFPKTKNGKDLMSDAPAPVSKEQLSRYGIQLKTSSS